MFQGARISVSTAGKGNAGNIIINAAESLNISGSYQGLINAIVTKEARGNGGRIEINTEQLTLNNPVKIAVDSQGKGEAGTIEIKAQDISLTNRAQISANTSASNNGGNINIEAQNLLSLRNQREITTSAGDKNASGNGGNITITTPFLIAFPEENNQIKANAFQGDGGKVIINVDDTFGIYEREAPYKDNLNAITAYSESSTQGVVKINTLNLNPNFGLTIQTPPIQNYSFPQVCQTNKTEKFIKFVNIGRGGQIPEPMDFYENDDPITSWLELKTQPMAQQPSPFINPKNQPISFSFACGF